MLGKVRLAMLGQKFCGGINQIFNLLQVVNLIFNWSFICYRLWKSTILLKVLIKELWGKWSLDRISLHLFSWSKVSVKLGVWSNSFLGCRLG